MGKKMNDEIHIRIREAFDYLYLHKRDMSSGQIKFIDSLKRQWKRKKELSDKQRKILFDMQKYIIPDYNIVRTTNKTRV